MRALGERAWPEITGRPTLLVPVGSTEQHGPHLPLDTDARVAAVVADRAAAADRALLVAPAVAFGASGEHEGFPGTVSIGHEALRLLLVELGRSAARWAGRLVFVNGHGGNVPTLADATRLLRYEGRDAAWFACAPEVTHTPVAPRPRSFWRSTPRSSGPTRPPPPGTQPRSPSCSPRCARAGWPW